jgi:hypothetical protein
MDDAGSAYEVFFRRYVEAYQRSLAGSVDADTIRSFFAEAFLALGLDGTVMAGKNDASFEQTLVQGFRFYKAIGTTRMTVDRVETSPLHAGHDRVRVFYVAHYRRRDGSALSIPFDVVYLLQRRREGPKIFAFIAGDEMALYREHGLVDERGQPA